MRQMPAGMGRTVMTEMMSEDKRAALGPGTTVTVAARDLLQEQKQVPQKISIP